jgi:predicted nucleic-acid-binding protein
MKIIVDTNVLVRFLVETEKGTEQNRIAVGLIEAAEEIIIPTHVFCEVVWVLSAGYKFKFDKIYAVFVNFLRMEKLVIREDEIEAGMLFLEKGGDFADGVNAYTGRVMSNGRAVFVSFDKQAVRLLAERGISAMVPQL